MIFINVFIITQAIFLLFQFIRILKLDQYQYAELMFGSFFIVFFFGLFGAILLVNQDMLDKSCLFATFYAIWFWITKKISNGVNSDSNGVIYY
jgi:hypothetical protein